MVDVMCSDPMQGAGNKNKAVNSLWGSDKSKLQNNFNL